MPFFLVLLCEHIYLLVDLPRKTEARQQMEKEKEHECGEIFSVESWKRWWKWAHYFIVQKRRLCTLGPPSTLETTLVLALERVGHDTRVGTSCTQLFF